MPQPRPATLIAELSYQCPLHCPYCSNPLDIGHEKYRDQLETEHWTRTFREARALGVRSSRSRAASRCCAAISSALRRRARRRPLLVAHHRRGPLHARAGRGAEVGRARPRADLDPEPDAEENDRIAGNRSFEKKIAAARLVREPGLPADDQLRAAPAEPRPDRGDTRSRARPRGAAARAREHAVLRLGGPNQDALMPSWEQLQRAEEAVQRFRERVGPKVDVLGASRLLRGPAEAVHGRLGPDGDRGRSERRRVPARRRRRSRGSSSPTSASIRSSGSGTSPTRSCASGARTGCRSRAARARSDARRWTSAAAAARRCGSRATPPPRTRFAGSRRITTASSRHASRRRPTGSSTARSSGRCAPDGSLRRPVRLDEPDGHQPMVTRVGDVLASLLREDIAPGRGGLVGARQQLVEESRDGWASIRQRRPKPMCQRSSSSTRSTPSRTPGRAPSARSMRSA